MIDTRKTEYPINFDHLPPIGTKITYWGGSVATLISQEPYVRKKDGVASHLLVWSFEDGRVGKSGLRSKTVIWEPEKATP